MRIQGLLIFLFALSFSAHSQEENIYQVTIKAKNVQERSRLANFLHLDEIYKDRVVVYVNDYQLSVIKRKLNQGNMKVLGRYSWKPVTTTSLSGKKPKPSPGQPNKEVEFPSGDEKYHTFNEVVTSLKQAAASAPELVKLVKFGNSVEGRELLGVKMTYGGFSDELKKPAMMLIGTHHAREHLSTEIPLMMIHHLIKLMKTNEEFQELMKNRVVYAIPLLNPDGAIHDIVGRRYKYWRKNRRLNKKGTWGDVFGVDLNRNYSFGWGTGGSSDNPGSDVYMGPEPFSEPETQAVQKFVNAHKNIKTMISFHTFSELILYPWGGKYDGVGGKEQQVFEKIAQKMATWNGYTPQQSSDLYIASGDTCDWAFGEFDIFCFTFELSPNANAGRRGFYPGAGIIDKTFESNINPVLYLLKLSDDPYQAL